jgi:uncharacterized protein (DUF885 family)
VTGLDELADAYITDVARLDPLLATSMGVAGYDDKMTDWSPDGFAARAELDRRTRAALDTVDVDRAHQEIARDAMIERLTLSIERYEAGDTASNFSVIDSALHRTRETFDLMPIDGEPAAANVAARLRAFPEAMAGYQRTLQEAARQGHVAARHQFVETAKQCDSWVDPAGDNFFPGLARRVIAAGPLPAALRDQLIDSADAARAATAEFAHYLRTVMAPLGPENQAVGRGRYELASRYFLGATVDLDETYAWGFQELATLEAEMRAVAGRIVPAGSVDDAVAALDADPARNIASKEAFRDWMQQLADTALRELHGTHFDIPAAVRRIEACIAPTSDGGVYYTGPSEDFSRPGRMWWAVPEGITTFSTWREVSTVYHEGVPGHHLQVGQTAARRELLNRWQRLLGWVSGHGEGWALYAERLMDELGYLSDPGEKLGMLDMQAFRACRVIVDIGMHLELEVPRDNPFGFHPGERWTPELGWEFLRGHSRMASPNLRFELNRYLGWPGQAPAYKVGERIWLQARADYQRRKGTDFDLKTFHRDALNLGSIGLDPLKAALARL